MHSKREIWKNSLICLLLGCRLGGLVPKISIIWKANSIDGNLAKKKKRNEKKILKRTKKAYDNPESFNVLPIVLTDVQNDSKEAESEVAQKNNLVISVFIRNKEIRKTHVGFESRGSTKNQNENTTSICNK